MITIERLLHVHAKSVKKIELAEDQVKYAGTGEEFLTEGSESVHLHVIKLENDVIGFFKIDTSYPSKYPFCQEGCLGLRAFAIDKKQQGKGLGQHSVKALFPYIKEHYPNHHAIYLTVNCKNLVAAACYRKAGFIDTNEKYHGGPAGPQHIMYGKVT